MGDVSEMLKNPYVQALLVGGLATGTLYAYHKYNSQEQERDEYLKVFGIVVAAAGVLAFVNQGGGGNLLSSGVKKSKEILTEPFSV